MRKFPGLFRRLHPEDFLAELLQDTPVTFYPYSEKTFVLSRNNQIYDALPNGFFGPLPDSLQPPGVVLATDQPQPPLPVFVNQEELASRPAQVETVRIGKQDRSASGSTFTLSGLCAGTGKWPADRRYGYPG